MPERLIITQETLLSVENSTLFYPCAGNDFFVPIHVFSPFVTEFWFVDRGYFSPGHQDTRDYGLDAPADQQPPLLQRDRDYDLIDTKIKGPPSWNRDIRDIEPCILTEIYKHLPSNRRIKIHRRRGYGVSAFQKEIGSLGVFFYRGDSQGEGGSGNLWMYSKRISAICEKLIDGGLIVTDGSQHSPRKDHIYREFWKYNWRHVVAEPEKIIQSVQPFTDYMGRSFTCLGFAGCRYGPTLIWQMRKPSETANVPKMTRTPRPKAVEPSMPSYYRDNRDGTVADMRTGLQWMRFSLGQEWKGGHCTGEASKYTWQEALDAAETLNRQGGYAGYQDWRVPTKDELETLLDPAYFSSIDPVAFPESAAYWYWSSSTNADSPYYSWRVNFYGGCVMAINRVHSSHVRLVRGKQ